MFYKAKKFNIGIGKWNTAKVTKMETMFEGAEAFNQDLSMWNVDKVMKNNGFLKDASKFDQDLCPWNNSLKFMSGVGNTDLQGTACKYPQKPSQNSFCHKCETCTDTASCPKRTCATATCGDGNVCSYDLMRKNVLTIDVYAGSFPGDVGFELKENSESSNYEVLKYAPQGTLSSENYIYEVDVCDGDHELCVTDQTGGVGAKVTILYKYTEKEVVKVEKTGKKKTCKTFTVEAM